MITKELVDESYIIRQLVDVGDFDESYRLSVIFLDKLERITTKSDNYFILLANIAGNLVDIGQMQKNSEASKLGFNLMKKNQEEFIKVQGECHFYYNYGNAMSNLVRVNNPHDHTFQTIEEMVSLKNIYWRAFILSFDEPEEYRAELAVNLANSLRSQFRLSESLRYYDLTNRKELDIPQAWVNRSASLIELNFISSSFSIKQLKEIREGYIRASVSKNIPPQWESFYLGRIAQTNDKIAEYAVDDETDEHDEALTQQEFEALSPYRQFCLRNHLTLSEHGLYCSCVGSATDNLVISSGGGVTGDFIIPMEMVLNRLKSEFSLARHLYFDYLYPHNTDYIKYESHFLELYNDEVLGIEIEKIRTAFRLCFGILDKIAVAICELYNLYPITKKGTPQKNIYFQSFWQLDVDNRRQLFEKVKSPGLLALYSIATDLNKDKGGELVFYKEWRNSLEHKFLVVHKGDKPEDVYESYQLIKDILFIKESDFIHHFEHLLQITRSAIFSFAFMVRYEGMKEKKEGIHYMTRELHTKNYSAD
ncbi:TPA: hypothetical protein QHB98_003405 [Citrobacter braakii]|nr:hypothetical protein [Citrobacter braakii]